MRVYNFTYWNVARISRNFFFLLPSKRNEEPKYISPDEEMKFCDSFGDMLMIEGLTSDSLLRLT